MSNGHGKSRIAIAIQEAASPELVQEADPLALLDEEDDPQERPVPKTRIGRAIFAGQRQPEISVASEGRAVGFAKGFAEAATAPLTFLDLDVDLPPGQIGGFTREAATGSRILGQITGTLASIAPYYLGAHAVLKGTGLAATMSQGGFQFARGAVAGGAFEAGFAETPEEAIVRGSLGAVAGGAIDNLIFNRGVAKAARIRDHAFDEKIAAQITQEIRRAAGRSISRNIEYVDARQAIRTKITDALALGDDLPGQTIFNEHGIATGVAARSVPGVGIANRAVELADDVLLPQGVSVDDLRFAKRPDVQAIDETTPGAGEARLYFGEQDEIALNRRFRALASEPDASGKIPIEYTNERGEISAGVYQPEGVVRPTLYGNREFDNEFVMPISRAEGKPLRFDPESGESVVRFSDDERAAMGQAFEGQASPDEIGEFLASGDQVLTKEEGQVVSSLLNRALETKMMEIENFASLGDAASFAQGVREFQSLQKAASKLDVYRPPLEAIVDDLKQIKVIDRARAKTRGQRFADVHLPVGHNAVDFPMDPDAFAIEQSLVGLGDDLSQDGIMKLALMGTDIDEQLEVAVTKLHTRLNQGGDTSFALDPQAVGRVERAIRKGMPSVKIAVYRHSKSESWMYVTHEHFNGPRALIKEIGEDVEKRALVGQLVDGNTGDVDWVALEELIDAPIVGELTPPPILQDVIDSKKYMGLWSDGGQLGNTTGLTQRVPRTGLMAVDQQYDAFQRFRTTVHEYAHAMWTTATLKRGPMRTIETNSFEHVYHDVYTSMSDDAWNKIFSRAQHHEDNAKLASEVVRLAAWVEDLKNSLHSIVTRPWADKVELEGAIKNGIARFNRTENGYGPSYFYSANELHSRAMDGLVVNRAVAEEIAPNVVKILLKEIADNSPKMQIILNNKRLARVDEVLNESAYKNVVELQNKTRIVGQLRTAATPAELAQIRTQGFFTGQYVSMPNYSREGFIALRREGDNFVMRGIWSDEEYKIPWAWVRQNNLMPNRQIAEGVLGDFRFNRFANSSFTTIEVPARLVGAGRVAGREDFVKMVKISLGGKRSPYTMDELRETMVRLIPEQADEFAHMPDDELLTAVTAHWHHQDYFENPMALMPGEEPLPSLIIQADDGIYIVERMQNPAVNELEQVRHIDEVAGQTVNQNGLYHITQRQFVEAYALTSGVNARDMPYVVDQAMAYLTKDLFENLDTTTAISVKNLFKHSANIRLGQPDEIAKSLAQLGIKPNKIANEAWFASRELDGVARAGGYTVDESFDGKLVVRTLDGQVAAVGRKPETLEWMRRAGTQRTELNSLETDLDTDLIQMLGRSESIGNDGLSFSSPPSGHARAPARPTGDGPGLGGGGTSPPPRFGDTMDSGLPPEEGFLSRFFRSIDLLAPMITGMETFSKTVERTFGVGANTRIFAPLQAAIRIVDQAYNAPRAGLAGKSLQEHLKSIESQIFKINKKADREAIVEFMEALSKEEIEKAGGLLQRDMTSLELGISAQIERLGLAHEMPRLVSTWQMMRSLVKGRKQFLKRYRSMSQQELPPEVAARLHQLNVYARGRKNFEMDQLIEELGLNPAQARIINMLEVLTANKIKPDQFSLMAVMRHAAAEKLPSGFSNMRAAVASRLNMTPAQLKIVKDLETLYDETFKIAGINPRRYISGYHPHLRVMSKEGILPNDRMMLDVMPREAGFAAKKYRTGELDIYSREPLSVAVKHVRGMLMHQHFDPHMKDVRRALKELKLKDERSYRIMREYVSELQGAPHKSFGDLQIAIESAAKAMGHEVGKDTSRQIINTLASLTYQALIPFRLGLIARNYFQMVQTVAPRTGMADFIAGFRIAMTKEGFEAARKAGAVVENVAPIMSQESLFHIDQTYKLSRRLQRVSDVGFRWYQKADDLGRAVAFHSQQVRTGRAIDNYMKGVYGRDPVKGVQKMLADGGVKTFDPVDQKVFSDLFRAGRIQEAQNHLGVMLSRETIFRYGHANHPAGWGSVYGRLFGQFGTWPVQYKDYLIQGMTRGTTADQIRFWSIHGSANIGVLAAGASLGYDLESWVSFPSLTYTGGPYANVAIDMIKVMGGNERERSMALRNLKFQFVPTLSDPRAIWLPGSYAVGDMAKLWNGEGGVDEALGFRRYKPGDEGIFEMFD